MADKGADLVIAQHTHCVGCAEEYNDATLIYGQGNIIFTSSQNEFWDTGLLVRVVLEDHKPSLEYIPIHQNRKGGVLLAKGNDATEILSGFQKRSEEILGNGFVERNYAKFARSQMDDYLFYLHGNDLVYRIFKKIFHLNLVRFSYTKRWILPLRNFVECEAHRELILAAIQK
jgi:poly-gamma-glutamate synthesis protein (capsule biosynthesis protein)